MCRVSILASFLETTFSITPTSGQAPGDANGTFEAGKPLNLSSNARTFGGFRFAESRSHDEARYLYIAIDAGIA